MFKYFDTLTLKIWKNIILFGVISESCQMLPSCSKWSFSKKYQITVSARVQSDVGIRVKYEKETAIFRK
jgi:putative component of membrane protein insertase Oxa1/YidC/SpoIIIJ protein YidD